MDINLQNTLIGHHNPIYTLTIDSDQQLLYSGGNDKGIVEWDLKSASFNRVLCQVPASVYCLTIIPQSNILLAGLRNGDILVIDRNTEVSLKAKLKVERGAIFRIQYIPSKSELVAIGEEGVAYVWDFNTFELVHRFEVSQTTVRGLALSNEEELLAFGDKDGYVSLFNAYDYSLYSRKKIHDKSVSSITFLDQHLYTGGRDAKLYKLSFTLNIIDSVVPHMFTVYGIQAITPSLFSTVSRDKTIKIWNSDLRLQKNISRDRGIESHFLSINAQDFDQNTGVLATASDDKTVKLWQLVDWV